MKRIFFVVLIAFFSVSAFAQNGLYNVLNFGAKGDDRTLNTKTIQEAINKAAEGGGGTVYFPAGKYITGTLFMKSFVSLQLESGAVLKGSKNLNDYPEIRIGFRFYADNYVNRALIYSEGVTNIGIKGDGVVDGQGSSEEFESKAYKIRPYLLWFVDCKKVCVNDVELRCPAMWMQYYLGCDNVRIENLKIYSHGNFNNDMIDIDGCRNVIIKGITGDSDDDGITFKSTYGRVSENIVVSECIIGSHCNGLKFGTETTGGFRNVTITNCIIRSSEVDKVLYGSREGISGISLEIVDGGVMENINISNIVIDGPKVPLFIRLGNRARKYFPEAPEPPVGKMKFINISNIIARASSKIGCAILGTPGNYIENLSLLNIRFICTGNGTNEDAHAVIPENEQEYPEALSFGTFSAYGLYIRHAKGLTLSDLSFELLEKDVRPLMWFDDVHYSTIKDIFVSEKHSTSEFQIEKNCTNLIIQGKPAIIK
jgi:polygalacturonase